MLVQTKNCLATALEIEFLATSARSIFYISPSVQRQRKVAHPQPTNSFLQVATTANNMCINIPTSPFLLVKSLAISYCIVAGDIIKMSSNEVIGIQMMSHTL